MKQGLQPRALKTHDKRLYNSPGESSEKKKEFIVYDGVKNVKGVTANGTLKTRGGTRGHHMREKRLRKGVVVGPDQKRKKLGVDDVHVREKGGENTGKETGLLRLFN